MIFNSNNIEEVKKFIESEPNNFIYLSDRLKDDDEVVRFAIKNKPLNFRYSSNRLRDNEEMALFAMENEIINFRYVSDRLKESLINKDEFTKLADNKIYSENVNILSELNEFISNPKSKSKNQVSNSIKHIRKNSNDSTKSKKLTHNEFI